MLSTAPFRGDAMCRMLAALAAALVLAALAESNRASAQAGCQPTLTQPCAKPPDRPADQTAKKAGRSGDATEPKDHSPRIQLDKDTEFRFGTGGIGLGRRF